MQGRQDDRAQEGAPPGGDALPERPGDGHEDEDLDPALAEPVLPDGPVHVLGPLEELPVVVCPAPLAGGPEKPFTLTPLKLASFVPRARVDL